MILLRQKREAKGLSQKRLAELSHVPQQTISAIENEDRTNPGIDTLYKLACALDCGLNEIYIPDWKGGAERDAG